MGELSKSDWLLQLSDRYRTYARTPIASEISPFDDMFMAGNLDHYMSVGRSAIELIADALAISEKRKCDSVLDLPCGGGRVTRHLVAFFPEAKIFVGEYDANKRDFVTDTFHVEAFEVWPDFRDAPQRKFDLIFVGSLFTHLDERHWRQAFHWFIAALEDEGLLLLTTHGRKNARMARHVYQLPEWNFMHQSYLLTGFGFQAYPDYKDHPIPYGGSLSAPSWVLKLAEQVPDVRIVGFREAAWDNHQDVLCLQKKAI